MVDADTIKIQTPCMDCGRKMLLTIPLESAS